MSQSKILGDRVWCPLCKDYTQLLTVPNAARLVNTHRRSIYRYIEEGLVYAPKVAGKRYRVCGGCLLRQG